MPGFVVAPNLIEQTDFSPGFAPDGPDAHTGVDDGLQDALNLLVDPSTRALVTRTGFDRLTTALALADDRWVKAIADVHAQARGNADGEGKHIYLVIATTNGASAQNNVKVFAYDLTSDTLVGRIDEHNIEWENPESDFWLIPVNNVLYGGSMGNPMFSWDGVDWEADASVNPDWRTLVDDVDDNVDQDDERGRDFAWKGTEKVIWDGDDKVYAVQKSIRYDDWDDSGKYTIGDRVSRTHTWGSTTHYYKSFRCVQAHDPADADTAPGTGADWTDYWKKVKLPLPQDEDGETPDSWAFMPSASQTKVAAWFANRLWLRFDGHGAGRLQYSAPTRPQKDKDIPLTYFDPTDFSPGNDLVGPGGGWLAVNDGRQAGPVTALHAFGQYLLIFKRQSVWSLSGWSEESFNLKRIREGIGCVSALAHTEFDGVCYFLSDDGLYMTDGTDVQAAPGNDGVRHYLKDRLDEMSFSYDGTEGISPQMWRFHEFVCISMYAASHDDPVRTIFYHPTTGSFWPTDLPVIAATSYSVGSASRAFFFAAHPSYSDDTFVFKYGDPDLAEDDEGRSDMGHTNDTLPISWFARTAWWPFGVLREQRRIRRTWALLKGGNDVSLKGYRDFDSSTAQYTVNDTEVSTSPRFVEGRVMKDSHAAQFRVAGASAPAAIHGISVETQPRRARYHVAGA